jgi:multidrug efflux pump subunit AcrA (membrane-fusion protein)
MIDTIYTRSIARQGNAYFFRLIALSLGFVLIVLAAFLNLSIKEVITTTGSVYPGQTEKIYAPDDLWLKLNRPLEGTRVEPGESIATLRHTLDEADLRDQIAARNDQIALLIARKQSPSAAPGGAAEQQRIDALEAEITILRREITWLEQQLQPETLKTTLGGELLSVKADASNFTFFHKGDLIAEIFAPDKLLLRAHVRPDQARQIQSGSAVVVEDRRSRLSIPGRIGRIFYQAGPGAMETEVVVEILADQLAQFKIGMSLDVRIVTAERKLFAILGDVFVD